MQKTITARGGSCDIEYFADRFYYYLDEYGNRSTKQIRKLMKRFRYILNNSFDALAEFNDYLGYFIDSDHEKVAFAAAYNELLEGVR